MVSIGRKIIYIIIGAKVEMVEKRSDYNRNTWFDLDYPPWSTAMYVLEKWGLKFQEMEHIIHDDADWVITVRNQNLERFLAKLTMILNITAHYQYEFIEFQLPEIIGKRPKALIHKTGVTEMVDWRSNLETMNNNDNFKWLEFDVIVGCEGAKSMVRNLSQIHFPIQEEFRLAHSLQYKVSKLHQGNMLVNFKSHNGSCPHLAKDIEGLPLDPRFPAFVIDGVTSVWKRFFHTHCQLQILFTQDFGNQIVENYEKHRPKQKTTAIFWDEKIPTNYTDAEPASWQVEVLK